MWWSSTGERRTDFGSSPSCSWRANGRKCLQRHFAVIGNGGKGIAENLLLSWSEMLISALKEVDNTRFFLDKVKRAWWQDPCASVSLPVLTWGKPTAPRVWVNSIQIQGDRESWHIVLWTLGWRKTLWNGDAPHSNVRSFISYAWPKPWSARRHAMLKLRCCGNAGCESFLMSFFLDFWGGLTWFTDNYCIHLSNQYCLLAPVTGKTRSHGWVQASQDEVSFSCFDIFDHLKIFNNLRFFRRALDIADEQLELKRERVTDGLQAMFLRVPPCAKDTLPPIKMDPSNSNYLSNTAVFHFHDYGGMST